MTVSKVKLILAGLLLTVFAAFMPATASAASASFSAESAASSYTVGDIFTVSIYETSSVDVDSARADLTYEAGLLEFKGITGGAFTTCLSQPNGGSGVITTGDCTVLGAKKQGKQLLATVTFKATAAGSAHLNFGGSSRLLNAGSDVSWTASNGAYSLSNPAPTPGQGGGSTPTPPANNPAPKANNSTSQVVATNTNTPVAETPAANTNEPQVTSTGDENKPESQEVKADTAQKDNKSTSKAPFFGLVAALLAVAVAAVALRKVQVERAAKAEAAAAAAAQRTAKAKKADGKKPAQKVSKK